MKKLTYILLMIVGILSNSTMAAEYGIGVGFGQNANTIYIPIKLSPDITLEPYITVGKDSSKSTLTAAPNYPYFNNATSSSSSSYAGYGLGVFAKRGVTDSGEIFGGARLAYVKSKQTDQSNGNTFTDQNITSEYTGYILAPTVGVEYFFQKNISMGAEVSAAYSNIKSKYDTPNYSTESRGTSTRTSTMISLRYYFK
jgi:hypothetical protein